MDNRSYGQFCGLAYGLDVVGERWTMLIVRELLAGPRRFTDLVAGLPGISTNLLSERLKGLEQQAIVRRRVLPPPAGSTVYELTPLGRALEGALLELGRWGSQFLPASLDGNALPSAGAIRLAIKAFFCPDRAQGLDQTYELRLGHEVMQAQVKDGTLHIRQGEARQPDAVFRTDMQAFLGLFTGQLEPDEAIAAGLVQVEGDPGALSQFLATCQTPGPPG